LWFTQGGEIDSADRNRKNTRHVSWANIPKPCQERQLTMTPSQQRGRTLLLSYFAAVVGLSVLVTALYVSNRGMEHLPVRAVRIGLTVALCAWLYSGNRAARILSIVLYGIAGYLSASALFSVGDNFWASIFLEITTACYISFAAVLMLSSSIEDFMKYQRDRGTAIPGSAAVKA
jgi:hypothetical protein